MTPRDINAMQTEAYADGRSDQIEEFAALLPGAHYMDPPDGGSVEVLDQFRRMAEDARKWREAQESAWDEVRFHIAENGRLMDAIAPILDAGHMNQEDLARLRAAYESVIPLSVRREEMAVISLLLCWEAEELSEGQMSALLDLDRVTLRQMRIDAIASGMKLAAAMKAPATPSPQTGWSHG